MHKPCGPADSFIRKRRDVEQVSVAVTYYGVCYQFQPNRQPGSGRPAPHSSMPELGFYVNVNVLMAKTYLRLPVA